MLLSTDVLTVGEGEDVGACGRATLGTVLQQRPAAASELQQGFEKQSSRLYATQLSSVGNYVACWRPRGSLLWTAALAALVVVGPRVDCTVSAWVSSACSADCGGGQLTRTRRVVQEPSGSGTPCGPLREEVSCNVNECRRPVVAEAWTEPKEPFVHEEFQVVLRGESLLPTTRVVLAQGGCPPRSNSDVHAGARCNEPGSSPRT